MVGLLFAVCLYGSPVAAAGQAADVAGPQEAPAGAHDHPPPARTWSFAVDGALFATATRQGGPRGRAEFRAQNWLMVAGNRALEHGVLVVTGMTTLEPLTVGGGGYSQIFQVGEAYRGRQVTDRQHPHDLVSQLSIGWQVSVGASRLLLIGAPVGEAALGPVPFMHRASAAENPFAPLSHHTFDSTHVASGVLLARMDRGPISIEGSVFRGRESDEYRYDLQFGALDSWSARLWLRPSSEWAVQVSHGFLREPERLEPGNQRRTNASVSWTRTRATGYSAVTLAAGRTDRPYSRVHAVLVEGTHRAGGTSAYVRAERVDLETEILLFPQVVHRPHPGELVDPLWALTLGGVRDVAAVRGLSIGVGVDATAHRPPALLEITHGSRPVSLRAFVRLAKADLSRRMLDATMASHAGHSH